MATERLKENNGVELTGQQKMVLFAKLSSGFWTENTNSIINPGNNLSEADLAKLRRDYTSELGIKSSPGEKSLGKCNHFQKKKKNVTTSKKNFFIFQKNSINYFIFQKNISKLV